MPCQTDEQTTIVAIVGRPPILAVGHQSVQVFLERLQVQLFELFGIVEICAHRIRGRGVLVQDFQVQLVWPPVFVPTHAVGALNSGPVHDRAFSGVVTVHCLFSDVGCSVPPKDKQKFGSAPLMNITYLELF